MADTITPSRDIARLIEIMAALRTPKTGCPWDLEQTFETIAPYTLEEAYEVADAIERRDLADLKDELGDLLLQVVYHARLAEEEGAFSFGDIVEGVSRKMIRRHPHVFGDETAGAASDVNVLWERIKAEERAEKEAARAEVSPSPHSSLGEGRGEGQQQTPAQAAAPHPNLLPASGRGEGLASILAEIPAGLPALTRALKLQDKAAKVGFDWPNLAPVFDKLKEELAEFEEVALPADPRSPPPRGEGLVVRGTPQGVVGGIPDRNVTESPPPGLPHKGGGKVGGAPQRVEGSDPAIKEELGDLLFVLANVARHLKIDPEGALRSANQKFIRRFHHIEQRLAEKGTSPAQSTLEEMDALWDEAKFLEDLDEA